MNNKICPNNCTICKRDQKYAFWSKPTYIVRVYKCTGSDQSKPCEFYICDSCIVDRKDCYTIKQLQVGENGEYFVTCINHESN